MTLLGLKVFQHRPGFLPASFGVSQQGNAMGAERNACRRIGLDDGAHYVELPEHRGCEQIKSRSAIPEKDRDVASPHVCSGPQSRLPVAPAPVPSGIYELWLSLD